MISEPGQNESSDVPNLEEGYNKTMVLQKKKMHEEESTQGEDVLNDSYDSQASPPENESSTMDTTRKICSSTIGSKTTSSPSQKVYGQETQQEQLIKAFERSCGHTDDDNHNNRGSELTVIAGPSGTGKTVLARTLQNHSRYFVLGKCDQFQQGSEPFGPFIVALTQLVDEILREDTETVQRLRSNVIDALPEVTQVNLLVDMVPALARLFFGKSHDSQFGLDNSFRASVMQHPDVENPILDIVHNLLRSICSQELTIVMVIDDIQWIDSSSLELLKKLTEEKPIEGFMLVTTCRDDEMTDANPAQQVLQNLQEDENGAEVLHILLGNLTLQAVNEIASDVFPTLPEMALDALCSVLYQHTKGNAFFVTQLIRRLENSGWKTPKYQEEMKGWDFEDHRSMVDRFIKYDCDALVDFLVVDTANESPLVRQVLKAASCLGSNFQASHVVLVLNGPKEDILEAMSLMEDRGMVNRRSGKDDGVWSWTHDKYQKAAYLMINKSERKSFHLSIGRHLLSNLVHEELQQYIFIVASQFGISLKLINDDGEKEKVSNIFLQAGKKSALSSSFTAASSYFAMGTSLLKADNWTSQYELSLRLYNASAEMECFLGHYKQTDKLVHVILRHARTLKDQIRAYEIKVYALSAKQETKQVTYLVLDIFGQLGEKFPAKPRFAKTIYEIMSTKYMLSNRTEDDIMSLPPLDDWKKIAMLQIMQHAFPALIRGNPELAVVISCRCMKLTLKFGMYGKTAGIFLTMCNVVLYPLGFIEEAIRLAKIAERIIEEHGVEEMKCRLHIIYYAFSLPYTYPLRDMLEPLERGGQLGILTGDIDVACQCLVFRGMTTISCGWGLEQVLLNATGCLKKFRGWGQQIHVSSISILAQTAENLMDIGGRTGGDDDDPCILKGELFDEVDWIEKSTEAQNDLEAIMFWLLKGYVALYLGEYTRCSEYMSMVMKQSLNVSSALMFQQMNFIAALVDVLTERDESYNNNNNNGRRRRKFTTRKIKFKSAMGKIQKYAKLGPDNMMNKIYLIEAETAVLNNDRENAILKFRKSIECANVQKFTHEEALAYERYATALLQWGNNDIESLEYFERSRCLYHQWGAFAKVKRLENYIRNTFGVNNITWGK